jgi:hypothetical protein
MAWIAAHLQDPEGLIAQPHMIHAHKGFDGIHVKIDPQTKDVTWVVICEEKATDNSRGMVRNRIWKDFEELEKGKRDNVLLAEVSIMLATRNDLDVDRAVETIIWKNARAYRIAITVDNAHKDPAGHQKLFKGYEGVVAGDVGRRRGEVFFLEDLRPWMASIAQKAVNKARELVDAHV